jgi:hypothetical protein
MAMSKIPPHKARHPGGRGFTIFFAVLVGGLALSIGMAIYDLIIRELDLSYNATQSQYAIYAADTGVECALYWDFKCPNDASYPYCARSGGSAFATSSNSSPGTGVMCNGRDVTTEAIAAGTWPLAGASATAATSTFVVTFQPQKYCAIVTVAKYGTPSKTTIESRGYNTGGTATTCGPQGAIRLERALQVTY